ncbi:MAG: cysteine--tRNA ligase [Nitrospinae bacterium]|nr:cysteine--tRNA ligase [Nitrospinota bacterium]
MALVVFNTLTQKKEPFVPLNPPKVGMYVCGVTVYDLCHIGHARAGVVFDVISRYLRFSGYDVTYVRNITDIDDKIIQRANERGVSWDGLAATFTDALHDDMGKLGMADPDIEPKATDHIVEMLAMIGTLVEKGHAYESGGSVWFAVKSFAPYGVLSKRELDDLMAGARVDVNEAKHDPLDFVLWKGSKPGEPSWESPWGPGRPGWHIECSAMGKKYLGEIFDIHGGGKDLVFPHHENEIAQSHACSGVAPVRYWLHNGFVTVNEEKMSKSLGNFFTIRDLMANHDPEALRFFLLGAHYRSPMDFADRYLVESYKSVARFYDLFAAIDTMDESSAGDDAGMVDAFTRAMDDDFNTATAVALLNGELRRLNTLRFDLPKMKKKPDQYRMGLESLLAGTATVRRLGGVLGLFTRKAADFVAEAKAKKLVEAGLSADELDGMLVARTAARGRKDFTTSDRIRDELAAKGILLQDGPAGTDWSVSFE